MKGSVVVATLILTAILRREVLSLDNASFYKLVYNQFIELAGDNTKTATVKDLVLKRDVGTFTMNQGVLYLCTPVNGRICAAVFIGKGAFVFTPPTEVERKQLNRFCAKETLEEPFNMLFLVFADTTFEELQAELQFGEGRVSREVNNDIEYCVKFLSDGRKDEYFDRSFMRTFLEGQRNELFYAHFSENKLEPDAFRIDPFEVEEVSFSRKDPDPRGYRWELVTQFHTQEDYRSGADQEDELKDQVIVSRYAIAATIERNLDFSATARLEVTSVRKNQHWIEFLLYPQLKVDSVFWGSGTPAAFIDDDDHYSLWVARDTAMKLGQVCSLQVRYHGDLLEQDQNARLILKSPSYWYPRHGFRSRAVYDMSFRYPSRYKFISVGTNISSREEGEDIVSHWVTDKPVKGASFNFGLFKEFAFGDSVRNLASTGKILLPPITVYMSEGMRRASGSLPSNTVRSVSRETMVDRVKNDIGQSSGYFSSIFGESPFNHLYASETPFLHGEAFPGMVNLSWGTFEYSSTKGLDEIFRAHEVAHQWWGIGVGFKTYHDQWLSEGLSEYCGIWYMQAALRDNNKFFEMLNLWREQIVNNRTYVLGKGQEAGPIWLGYRTNGSKTRGDYDLIIYKKGAWVVHMLRNMMLDLKTLSEDRFKDLMKDFYRTYHDHDASTLDFQRMVENHVGEDMTWFFQEWVFDTRVPSYTFSYKTVQTGDSTFVVKCRLLQRNVSENFRMYIPIQLKFPNGLAARFRINVKGDRMEFDLPPMPMEPSDVVFNYLTSVLCESEIVPWE